MKFRTLVILALSIMLPAAAVAQDPVLTVTEPELGTWEFTGLVAAPIALGVPSEYGLEFGWLGDASGYGGTILGYRYGWDIVDPDNPFDPGWTTPGYVVDLLAAPTISFTHGEHSLHVEVADTAGGLTRAWFTLQIAPPVAVEARTWGAVKTLFGR